jgi:hypothetical protein
MGIPLWCQDEAGPYQAVPQPGQSWQPEGKPYCQPHEYIRGGTAKLLTLFRPATGEVRAKGVSRAPNAVLHPWLKNELLQILEELPELAVGDSDAPAAARWATWLGHVPHLQLPPLRLLLIWDNLAGHLSTDMVTYLVVRTWDHAAVHPNQRVLAEYGRIGAAHPRRPGLARTASDNSEGVDHLVGGRGGGLERYANAVHLGRQTQGASNPRKTASSRWLSRNHSPASVNCGMTH